MIAIILITTWGGIELDKLAKFHTPVFTIILSLLGVFAAIYTAVKILSGNESNETSFVRYLFLAYFAQ